MVQEIKVTFHHELIFIENFKAVIFSFYLRRVEARGHKEMASRFYEKDSRENLVPHKDKRLKGREILINRIEIRVILFSIQ